MRLDTKRKQIHFSYLTKTDCDLNTLSTESRHRINRPCLKLNMFICLVLCLSLVASCFAEQVPLHRAKTALPGSYIVKLKTGASIDHVIDKLTRDVDIRLSEVAIQQTFSDVFNGFAAKLSENALRYIRSLEEVEYVSENGVIRLPRSSIGQRVHSFDQRATAGQWALDRIDQEQLPLDRQYNPPNHGENVEIWIFDTGIRKTHKEFKGRSVRIAYDIDAQNGGNDPWGHGTLCTSVAAGNWYGTANKANIVVAKVISKNFARIGTWAALMKALDVMAKTAVKPAVASISLGEGGTNKALEDAVIAVMDKGFTVAVAAGNANIDACQDFPANFKRVITVGASTIKDTRWYSSNHGSCVDIFAPGKDITGAYIGNDFIVERVSGTSEATPIVAGAAAILLSTQRDLTHDQVKANLLSNATPNVLQTPLPAGSPNLLLKV